MSANGNGYPPAWQGGFDGEPGQWSADRNPQQPEELPQQGGSPFDGAPGVPGPWGGQQPYEGMRGMPGHPAETPYGYAPNPFQPERSRRRGRAWAWAVAALVAVGAVVGILFATGVFGKKGDEANEPTAEPSTSVTSPKRETPTEPTSRPSTPSTTGSSPSPDRPSLPTEPTTVTAGQPVQVGDFQMTFLEFNPNATSALAARGLTPQSGSKFVGVKLKATNTSAKEERPGKVGLMIEGVYMETLGYHESDGMRSVSSLQPGQSVDAWQYIQIPESMQPTSYTYNYYSTDYNIYKSAKNITVRIS